MLHFPRAGVAEAEFAADLRGALKRCFFALSGDAPAGSWLPDAPAGRRSSRCCPSRPTGR